MATTLKRIPAPTSADVNHAAIRCGVGGHRQSGTSRRSVLSATTAAIAAVVAKVFEGVDANERNDAALRGALIHARLLISECITITQKAPECLDTVGLCATDPWWSDLQQVEALLDVVAEINPDVFITSFSRDVAGSYFSAIQAATLRALDGLQAAVKTEEVCHA
jgi:hypothetical protein